ncbi:uncharacterized protein LOC120286152 isoform X2 [Eucalyptus grandis]|uniref:uncharacterized protein LOC120286152 isoform X2 n=1 Tax=Eucalyptus grandis TaxID=71139 RepID=UPI00192E7D26|nr:uncharacterized protein LOC120286152 isoform X2 [Eucalyptus grandis]
MCTGRRLWSSFFYAEGTSMVVKDSVGHHLINREGLRWEPFVEQRQDLLKEAGQWMKDTASSCSLVATLIITVTFAAAFTIPGGNDNNTGIPIFLKKPSFMVFTAANALALFSSITATLMFLAILTSRYAAEDFLHSLPRKMDLVMAERLLMKHLDAPGKWLQERHRRILMNKFCGKYLRDKHRHHYIVYSDEVQDAYEHNQQLRNPATTAIQQKIHGLSYTVYGKSDVRRLMF